MDVEAKLREKICREEAEAKGERLREDKLDTAESEAQKSALRSWAKLSSQAELCTNLDVDDRKPCIAEVQKWIDTAKGLKVSIDAGTEVSKTTCGQRESIHAELSRRVEVEQLALAANLLKRLIDSTQKRGVGSVLEYLERGDTAYADGEYRDAMAAYKIALGMEPRHPTANYGLGLSALRLGDQQTARSALCKARNLSSGASKMRRDVNAIMNVKGFSCPSTTW
jgi:tetratricopeptide (TPR) repeat protein